MNISISELLINSPWTPYLIVALVVLSTYALSKLILGKNKKKLRRLVIDFQVNFVVVSLFCLIIGAGGYALQRATFKGNPVPPLAQKDQSAKSLSNDLKHVSWENGPTAVSRWAQAIQLSSEKCDVDPALIAAIMRQESVGNPTICSSAGACGLMQLMPGTASDLGVTDRFDPQQNLNGGACYIRKMLDMFDSRDKALAAYNAGPGNVQKYGGVPPFDETRLYVLNVTKYYEMYKSASSSSDRKDEVTKLLWPVTGRITQQPSSSHMALDIAIVLATPVLSPESGEIVKSSWFGDYGKTVIVDHGGGLHTLHAHLSSFTKQVGDKVERGTIIGRSGSTGRSTGPHLHFEVRQDGVLQNPWNYLGDQSEHDLAKQSPAVTPVPTLGVQDAVESVVEEVVNVVSSELLPVSQNYPVAQPQTAQGLITNGPRDTSKKIALTFDACQTGTQTGYDLEIEQILRETKTPATMFLSGLWVQSNLQKAKELYSSDLFEVGGHGWAHQDFSKITKDEMLLELRSTQDAFNAYGIETDLFRFPFGTHTDLALDVVQEQGLRAIQWDIVSGDPDPKVTSDAMVKSILSQAQSGSIVIMHINGKGWHTADALEVLIPTLESQGYTFVTVSDLLN